MTGYLPTTFILTCLLAALLLPTIQASHDYVIQIQIYVDKLAFDTWKADNGKTSEGDMEREIRAKMGKAEDIYQALDDSKWPYLKISFEITGITFLRRNNEMNFTLHQAHTNVMNHGKKNLDTFARWISRRPEGFDLAFLFTGYDVTTLYKNDLYQSTIGMGYVGLICRPSAVAFLEVGYGMKSPTSIAHEIGHVLGAYDDGHTTYPPNNCSDTGYLMAPSIEISPQILFSKCTLSSLYDSLVTKDKSKCLLEDSLDKVIDPAMDKTADQVCRELKGNNWEMSRASYMVNNYGDNFCRNFRCVATINDKLQWHLHGQAPDGLKCGKVTFKAEPTYNERVDRKKYSQHCPPRTNCSSYLSDPCGFQLIFGGLCYNGAFTSKLRDITHINISERRIRYAMDSLNATDVHVGGFSVFGLLLAFSLIAYFLFAIYWLWGYTCRVLLEYDSVGRTGSGSPPLSASLTTNPNANEFHYLPSYTRAHFQTRPSAPSYETNGFKREEINTQHSPNRVSTDTAPMWTPMNIRSRE